MPRVRVEWLEGRSQAQKEALADRITAAVVEVVHVRPDQVTVIFQETPAHNMFKAGKAYAPVTPVE